MKALLVQSPATSPWVPRRQWEPPSVAMATIAGQIDNHDVRVADMVVWRNQAVPRFLELLRTFKPDVVGFTSMTFQYETTAGFAYLTKQFDQPHPHRTGRLSRHVVLRIHRHWPGRGPVGLPHARRGRLCIRRDAGQH